MAPQRTVSLGMVNALFALSLLGCGAEPGSDGANAGTGAASTADGSSAGAGSSAGSSVGSAGNGTASPSGSSPGAAQPGAADGASGGGAPLPGGSAGVQDDAVDHAVGGVNDPGAGDPGGQDPSVTDPAADDTTDDGAATDDASAVMDDAAMDDTALDDVALDDAAMGGAADDAAASDDAASDDAATDDTASDDAASGDPGQGATTDTSAAEVMSQARFGWNLGNSLDAPEGETSWGNPVVNETLIGAVAQAGFGLVRVPVSWSLYLGPGPDYVIDPSWLARVEEVVGYVTSRGLYAVINLHHDGADGYSGVEWLSLNDESGAISAEHDARVDAQFVALWQQIAAHFEPHGDLLLFEGMNEIHDGYDTPRSEYLVRVNELNQLFVDTVRESGGNNAQRVLVVPGYNTNIDHTLSGFELPVDSASGKLALSVHFYDPWSYAGEASTNTWGAASPGADSWGQEDFVVGQFDKLQAEYVSQGVPVMMGEYGAVNQSGYENYRRYYMEYVTKAAIDRGITPVYWDNGGMGSGPDNFALFDRSSGAVVHGDILDAIVRAATDSYALSDVALP